MRATSEFGYNGSDEMEVPILPCLLHMYNFSEKVQKAPLSVPTGDVRLFNEQDCHQLTLTGSTNVYLHIIMAEPKILTVFLVLL